MGMEESMGRAGDALQGCSLGCCMGFSFKERFSSQEEQELEWNSSSCLVPGAGCSHGKWGLALSLYPAPGNSFDLFRTYKG